MITLLHPQVIDGGREHGFRRSSSHRIRKGYVDHTTYDTTSILRLIEWKHDLLPLGERKSNNRQTP